MSEVAEMDITKAIENKIDRSKWVNWKFSDLVENIVEKVVPKESGLEHYIGLEHLDTESLKIRRFGETSTLIGDKLKIYKGDLIFAKRNAYLKRVAIAEFDAVASAHSMVLRPKPKNVNPDFLPFFMMSEMFWKRAIEISVGSLSPTINWKALAKQEFLLPPKHQQAQLSELLWAMDEVIETKEHLTDSMQHFYNSKREELLNKTINGKQVKLGDISRLQGGATFKSTDSTDEGVKWLKIANVGFHEVKWDDESYLPTNFLNEYPEFVLNEGDIVIALTRPILGDRLKIARINGDDSGSLLNQRVGRIKLKDDSILQSYLFEHLKSNSFLLAMKRELQGTDPPNISNSMYENYQITLPDLITQQEIQEILIDIQSNYLKSKTNATISKALQKSLINQIF